MNLKEKRISLKPGSLLVSTKQFGLYVQISKGMKMNTIISKYAHVDKKSEVKE